MFMVLGLLCLMQIPELGICNAVYFCEGDILTYK